MSSNSTNVYKALFGNARQTQYNDFVIVEHPMHGGFVSPAMAFRSAYSWARQTRSSGNSFRDKQLFMNRLPVVVASKTGTLAASKGGAQQIAQLAKSMQGAGLDLSGWDLPPNMLKPANKPTSSPADTTPADAPPAAADTVVEAMPNVATPAEEHVVVSVDFRNRRRA